MTTKEFNNLKVGDSVPIPTYKGSDKYCSSQITEINRTQKRIKTIGSNKLVHFSKIKRKVHWEQIRSMMGVNPPYEIVEKLQCPNQL